MPRRLAASRSSDTASRAVPSSVLRLNTQRAAVRTTATPMSQSWTGKTRPPRTSLTVDEPKNGTCRALPPQITAVTPLRRVAAPTVVTSWASTPLVGRMAIRSSSPATAATIAAASTKTIPTFSFSTSRPQ